jgi:hypothetical protein
MTTAKKKQRTAVAVATKAGSSLVLRTCNEDMRSNRGFVWPCVGETAECPDWKPTNECGNGLHGWLHGAGDHSCSSYLDETAKWLVLEVATDSIIHLGGKIKFPRALVRFVGDRKAATDYLLANDPRSLNVAVIGAQLQVGDKATVMVGALGTATAGYSGTATAGYSGTATAGDRGTATAGYSGTATAGDRGTATAGDSGTATAGYSGTATAGDRGTATAGDRGTATAGYSGTATAGDRGTATAGDSGTATAGDSGTATAGDSGTATAGELGEIRIRWWDESNDRYRTVIGYVGEGGIKPRVAYRLDANRKFVEAKP